MSVRVLSRVCPHRAMDIMPEGFGYDGHTLAEARADRPDCGQTRLFLCPYHAWTFELDGKLKACPEMQQAENFCRDDFALKPFRSGNLAGFYFCEPRWQRAAACRRSRRDGHGSRRVPTGRNEARHRARMGLPVQLESAGGKFHGELPPPRHPSQDRSSR